MDKKTAQAAVIAWVDNAALSYGEGRIDAADFANLMTALAHFLLDAWFDGDVKEPNQLLPGGELGKSFWHQAVEALGDE